MTTREETPEELQEYLHTMATWLGESDAELTVLLNWMERAQGNIPPELRKLIKETRENLTRRQDSFFKKFGDWNKPGEN